MSDVDGSFEKGLESKKGLGGMYVRMVLRAGRESLCAFGVLALATMVTAKTSLSLLGHEQWRGALYNAQL
jgi:hypothetical protein